MCSTFLCFRQVAHATIPRITPRTLPLAGDWVPRPNLTSTPQCAKGWIRSSGCLAAWEIEKAAREIEKTKRFEELQQKRGNNKKWLPDRNNPYEMKLRQQKDAKNVREQRRQIKKRAKAFAQTVEEAMTKAEEDAAAEAAHKMVAESWSKMYRVHESETAPTSSTSSYTQMKHEHEAAPTSSTSSSSQMKHEHEPAPRSSNASSSTHCKKMRMTCDNVAAPTSKVNQNNKRSPAPGADDEEDDSDDELEVVQKTKHVQKKRKIIMDDDDDDDDD